IKEDVIPDDVLKEEPDPSADHRLAIVAGIPRKTDLRRQISVGLLYPIAVSRKFSVDFRDCRQITVGTASVAVIAQAEAHGKVRLDLPRVADIEADPVIRSKAAGWEAQSRIKSGESLSIAYAQPVHWVVQWIGRTSWKRTDVC